MSDAPGGLSDAEFKAWYVEAGDWLWGTVQGNFNEKMSVSQIVVDAVIGMIPLVGDVTAVRDLIAVSMGMAGSEEKRDSVLEWVTVVILLLALIPVLGGVIKGVGKLVVRAARQAAKASPATVLRVLAHTAEEIIEFMNRLGIGNAKKWFLDLNIMKFQPEVLKHFSDFTNGIILAIDKVLRRMSFILPASHIDWLKSVSAAMKSLAEKGKEMIPKAVKEFHEMLVWMQTYIRTGGAPELALHAAATGGAHATANATHAAANTAQSTSHAAQAGGKAEGMKAVIPEAKPPKGEPLPKPGVVDKESTVAGKTNITKTKEARLKEKRYADPPPKVGGYKQNEAVVGAKTGTKGDYSKHYTPDPANGYPDLRNKVEGNRYPHIEAYSGKMTNREPIPEEMFYRIYGPKRKTRGIQVDEARAGGPWWGLGRQPQTAEEWRKYAAVLDEYNGDTYIIKAIAPKNPKQPVKGVFGKVSEQNSKNIAGQHLPGGWDQAYLNFSKDTNELVTAYGRAVMRKKGGEVTKFMDPRTKKYINVVDGCFECPLTGWTFRAEPTGWPDANGIFGYAQGGNVTNTVSTVPLSKTAAATVPQTLPNTHVKQP